jgi:orotidine-5'-phosphate decarboxylase
MRERIIVALDLPDVDEAVVMAAGLRGRVPRVKVGLTLFGASGPDVVRRLRELDFGVFLDLKLHDIPHQVAGAARELTRLGVEMFTVHAGGGRAMMRAAVEAAAHAAEREGVDRPLVLAVTVLTSLDDEALREVGVARGPSEQVLSLAELAREAGADGVVCSPQEASDVRLLLGQDALVVTPGVRPSWAAASDQARVATPADAVAEGASHLVIGRPITDAPDPAEALERIVEEG